MSFVFVVGDLHGEQEKLTHVLRRAGLLGMSGAWTGRDSTLCFTGDYLDRGPDGVGVIEFIRRLERQVRAAGGQVHSLLGNHDVAFLAAYRFGTREVAGLGSNFHTIWEENGGRPADLERVQPDHLAWLATRPAMTLLDQRLVIHVDSPFYSRYGRTIAQVNDAVGRILAGDRLDDWAQLLVEMSHRNRFANRRGPARAIALLHRFGGRQIIHGHTPISNMMNLDPTITRWPFTYAAGRCVNVDGGMCFGGPGFVYRLPSLTTMVSHRARRAHGRNIAHA